MPIDIKDEEAFEVAEKIRINVSNQKFPLPDGFIEIEITVSMVMQDVERVVVNHDELKNRGGGLSLDDFGTGYSGLSFSETVPFGKLKIDWSFSRLRPCRF